MIPNNINNKVLYQQAQYVRRGLENFRRQHCPLTASTAAQIELAQSLQPCIDQSQSTVQELCKVHRIGVVGLVAAGKSTYVNNLIGVDVLSTGNGAVTAVPTELSHSSDGKYRLTLHYVPRERFLEDMRFLRRTRLSGGLEREALVLRYSAVFENMESFDAEHYVAPIPRPEALHDGRRAIDLIGAAPFEQEFTNAADVRQVLDNLLRVTPPVSLPANGILDPYASVEPVQENRLPYLLEKVCVQGPFANLPDHVVLVDTPGLEDSNLLSHMRTLAELPKLQEVWVLVDQDRLLSSKTIQKVIMDCTFQYSIPVNVGITKCRDFFDVSKSEECRNQFQYKQRRAVIDQLKIFFKGLDDTMEKVRAIPIHLSDYSQGLDAWTAKLDELRQAREDREAALRAEFDQLVASFASIGTDGPVIDGQVANQSQQHFDAMINAARNNLRQVVATHGDALYDRISTVGDWSRIHWKTWRAFLDPNRRGEFFTESKAVGPKHLSIQSDILYVWHTQTLSKELSRIARLVQAHFAPIVAGHRPAAMMLQQFRGNVSNILGNSIALFLQDAVRNELTRAGLYNSFGRGYGPNRTEIDAVIQNVLLPHEDNLVLRFLQALDSFFRSISRPTVKGIWTEELRSGLLALFTPERLNSAHAFEQEFRDIECSISMTSIYEMVEPVRIGCGSHLHVFERAAIEEWLQQSATCTLCRQPVDPTRLFPAYDIMGLVRDSRRARLAEPPLEGEQGSWWAAAWMQIVEAVAGVGEPIGDEDSVA